MLRKFNPVKGGVLQNKYAAFDTETEGLYGRAKLICMVTMEGKELVFTGDNCVKEFIYEVSRFKYAGYHFYSHNLPFDLEKTFGAMFGNTLDNKRFTVYQAGTRMIKAVYNLNDTKRITFLDTLNLVPGTKLSSIGVDLGFKKFKTPDKWLSGKEVNNVDQQDIDYCLRDCKIVLKLLDAFKEFLSPFKLKLKPTIAANAKAVWKSIYLKEKNFFLDEVKDERFRESYYGGRTEVFIRGHVKKHLYHYDVNSLYPSVMRDNKFPNPDKLKYSKDIYKALRDDEGCAKLTVVAPDMDYPVLPFRTDKLIFPTGEFTGVWNFPEIRLAIEKGYKIVETHWVLSSKPMDSPFNEYIEYFGKMKIKYGEEGKEVLRNLSKRFLNSLYGKFAQRNDVEERYTKERPPEGVIYKRVGENTYKLITVEKERSNETVVCFSSYITSYARVALYSFFPKSGLFYCDTDSTFTDTPLPPEVVDESEFGLMCLEDEILEANFVAPKRYAYSDLEGNEIKKTKGVRQEVVNNIPLQTFDSPLGVFYDKPSKLITSLNRNIESYSKEAVKKNFSIDSSKRLFDEKGFSIPIFIPTPKPLSKSKFN